MSFTALLYYSWGFIALFQLTFTFIYSVFSKKFQQNKRILNRLRSVYFVEIENFLLKVLKIKVKIS